MRDGILINSIPPEIRQDLTVSGDVRVRGEVRIFPGATVTVEPGTRFLFEPFDPDEDGVNDSRLVVEGVLVARGDPDAPIYFASAAPDPEPGDWLELRMDHSEGSVLEYCVLEHSRYGLHVHFSSGVVANCLFRNNIDGTRFGNSTFDLLFNRVTGNLGKGINLRNSQLHVMGNVIEGNRHGVFLFEEGSGSALLLNRFDGNEVSDVRFGDFYEGQPPELAGNHRPDGAPIGVMGYEKDLPRIPGPLDPDPSRLTTGPRRLQYRLADLWIRELGSFIDAPPVLTGTDGEKVIVSTWGDGLHILDAGSGQTVARVQVPDVTDAAPLLYAEQPDDPPVPSTPVADGERIVFPSWDLRLRKADVRSGEIVGEISWDASPMDDHRQAAPLGFWMEGRGTLAALGLWNGLFGVLDPGSMEWLWTVPLDGAVRAGAVKDGDHLWVGTDGGSLYRLGMDGTVVGRVDVGSPLRTTPLVIDSGNIIAVTWAGVLMRIDDGKVVWRRKLPGTGTYASPRWVGSARRYVAVGDGLGNLSAYNTSGALMWRTSAGSAIHAIVGDDLLAGVLVGTEDGFLVGFGGTGREVFRLKADGAVHGLVSRAVPRHGSAAGTRVFWGSRDGTVRGTRVTGELVPWGDPQ